MRFRSSHSGEDDNVLGCDSKAKPTFCRLYVALFKGSYVNLKRRFVPTGLHGVITQKIMQLIVFVSSENWHCQEACICNKSNANENRAGCIALRLSTLVSKFWSRQNYFLSFCGVFHSYQTKDEILHCNWPRSHVFKVFLTNHLWWCGLVTVEMVRWNST